MQSADFFRADNPEGIEARNEVNMNLLCMPFNQIDKLSCRYEKTNSIFRFMSVILVPTF